MPHRRSAARESIQEAAPHKSIKLWRYMNLPKFVSLLGSQAVWFTRADKFEDKWEGLSRIIPYVQPKDDRSPARTIYEEFIKTNAKGWSKLRAHAFVSCWTMSEDSISMWKSYGSYDEGVAIQTSDEKFNQSVNIPQEYVSHAAGVVEYYESMPPVVGNYKEGIKWSLKMEQEVMLQKHARFAFEKEWRAVIVASPQASKRDGMSIKIGSINELIERVVVSPLAPSWFFDSVAKLAEAFKLEAKPKYSEHARRRPRRSPAIVRQRSAPASP